MTRYMPFAEYLNLAPEKFRLTLTPRPVLVWDGITVSADMTTRDVLALRSWYKKAYRNDFITIYLSENEDRYVSELAVYELKRYHKFILKRIKVNDLKLQCSLDFENDKMIWISLWVWDKCASPNDEMIHIYHQEVDRNKKMESLRYPWGMLTLGETDSSRDVRVKNVLVELK